MTAPRRPPMLTVSCAYLGALAAILSVRAMVMVSTWNAEAGAEKVGPQLEALRDAGASQAGAESGYKVFLTVLAVLAAAGVVFAVYTARGDRASRVGLTVVMSLVGVLFFLGATGGTLVDAVIGALALVFTFRLWRGDAKAWFTALRTGEPMATRGPAGTPSRPDPFAGHPAHVEQQTSPAAEQPSVPTATHPIHPAASPGVVPGGGRAPMPRSVGIAAWTALVGSALAGLGSAMMLLVFVVIGTDYDSWVAQGGPGADLLEGQESQFESVVRYLFALSAISIVLAAGGLFAAIRVLVARGSGDVVLFVMTVVSLVVTVIGFPIFPFSALWTAAAIVALVQLRRPESKQWFVKT